MLKKLLLAFILITSLALALPASADDFSTMNPTVRITSYKKLFTDKILAYGSGSGTVISKNGLVITNNHVIFDDSEQKPLDAFEVCITFDVKEEPVCKYTARLMANDKDLDVAILKINPTDVFGQTLPDLKYMNFETSAAPKEGDTVQVVGYPGSGGETVTISKGQISGFDTYNGYKYFKTDTDFDFGSSGGTALDAEGNYIGIPTYIRSYAENVGYFLDLRLAVTWIKSHMNDSQITNEKAEDRLKMELERLKKANDNNKFAYSEYPKLSITVPTDWKFYSIDDDGVYVEQEKVDNAVGLSAFSYYYQYEIDKGYMDKLDEELVKVKDQYPDFKKEAFDFNGYDGYLLTYTAYNSRHYSIYIPYGYALINIAYSINLDEEESQMKAIQPVLDSIKLDSEMVTDPNLSQTLSFEDPGFSITMPDGWRIQENMSNSPADLLADAVQKDNFDGYLDINYRMIPKDEKELSNKDRMDEKTEYVSGLISKNDDAVLDGLPGWLYTYEYEGDDYQKMHKKIVFNLQNGEYEFTIEYDDLSENFDKNIPDIESILRSFKITGGNGKYDFGSLSYNFKDIQYHRYADAIISLADKGIVRGYGDGTFQPEKPITRAEALKIILESKNNLEKEKDLGKEADFDSYSYANDGIKDVKSGDWFNGYVQYALENKIVSGYSDKTFRPDKTVNLVEALKMIFGVYEIPLWQGTTDPWYKLYMDKGYELGLVGSGLDDPSKELTRAELSSLVDDIYSSADNSGWNF
jgi:S1-C subfamily serine protease